MSAISCASAGRSSVPPEKPRQLASTSKGNASPVLKSWIAWAVYLWGYELLFRGFLLFELVAHWGVWPGLTVSTVLYVMAHLDKLADETAGSLFAGFLFGAMALLSGGIWAPWLLHTLIATVTESLAARANPTIDYGA